MDPLLNLIDHLKKRDHIQFVGDSPFSNVYEDNTFSSFGFNMFMHLNIFENKQ